MKRFLLPIAILVAVALVGCGGGDSTDRNAALTTGSTGGTGSSTEKQYGSPPGVTVKKSAARRAKNQSIKSIIRQAEPLPVPIAPGGKKREQLPPGKKLRARGANPKSGKVPLKAKRQVPISRAGSGPTP